MGNLISFKARTIMTGQGFSKHKQDKETNCFLEIKSVKCVLPATCVKIYSKLLIFVKYYLLLIFLVSKQTNLDDNKF